MLFIKILFDQPRLMFLLYFLAQLHIMDEGNALEMVDVCVGGDGQAEMRVTLMVECIIIELL